MSETPPTYGEKRQVKKFSTTIILPLFVMLPRKTRQDKRVALNLNVYRNLHYHYLNKAKVVFAEEIADEIAKLPRLTKVECHYTLFPNTRRRMDFDNVISIINKFFQDALVEAGKLPDDNYNVWVRTVATIGNVDSGNGRVEATIYGLEEG